jgi:hypothetical protein
VQINDFGGFNQFIEVIFMLNRKVLSFDLQRLKCTFCLDVASPFQEQRPGCPAYILFTPS